MKILLIEPYFTGSHRSWAQELQQFSNHEVRILQLSGHYWKWRMHGGGVTLARKFLKDNYLPDLILATDMLDLTTFLSLTRKETAGIPCALYFHENQLVYPWSPTDRDIIHKRDNHYSFINYSSALTADRILFNSHYHHDAFFDALPKFLKHFPDHNELRSVEDLKEKSGVLPLGLDLRRFEAFEDLKHKAPDRAVLLWNHRWEHDKNPEDFFKALYELQDRGVDFRLIVAGENFSQQPKVFEEARKKLSEKILHFGYVEDFETYAALVHQSDIIPITSIHDFFGVSLVQAMYCNVIPLLPKRLSYPEHIPEELHSTFFYQDQEDFVDRLQRLIFNVKVIRNQDVRKFVARYDWGNLAAVYDAEFEALNSEM